jgi:hypothetical protein
LIFFYNSIYKRSSEMLTDDVLNMMMSWLGN